MRWSPQLIGLVLTAASAGSGCKYPELPELAADGPDGDGPGDAAIDGPVGPTFVRSYGASAEEFAMFVAARGDAIVLGGPSNDGIEIVGGDPVGPFFVASLDATGRPVWSKSLPDVAYDAAIDRFGNTYVVGGFGVPLNVGGPTLTPTDQDMFIAKFDPMGNHLWSRGYGGASLQEGWRIDVMPDDDIVVCGEFIGSASFGGGPLGGHGQVEADVFVAKFSRTDGAHKWSTPLGGNGGDHCRGVVATATGSVAAFGYFSGTFNVNGTVHQSAGSTDVFAVGLGPSGNPMWSQRFGGAGFDTLEDASQSPQGDTLVAGSFAEDFMMGGALLDNEASADGFVARIAPVSGTVAWAKAVSGSRIETVASAAAMGNEVVIAGTTSGPARVASMPLSPPNPSKDLYTARLRFSDGGPISVHAFGGDSFPMTAAVLQGTIVMTGGYTSPSIDFGIDVATHTGAGTDVYVARVVP